MPDSQALRVASFNIRTARAFDGRNSWPLRRRATAAALRDLEADVAGLQEVHRGAGRFLVRSLGDVAAVGAGRTDGRRGERCLIVYRPDRLRLLRWTTRWLADDPGRPGARLPGASFPRVATLAEFVDRGSGRHLAVANTHLDEHLDHNRLAAARLLAAWLAPHLPWVVLGDFNAGPSSAAFRPLLDAGLRPVLPADAGGTAHGFTGRADGPRIDHILVRGPWDVVGSGVVRSRPRGRLPSDHWPVTADLRLRDPAP